MGAQPKCDNDGKMRDVSGGKVCENGHFICNYCNYGKSHCPLSVSRLNNPPFLLTKPHNVAVSFFSLTVIQEY